MAFKGMESLGIQLSDDVARVMDSLTELRRELHQHPELPHREEATQRLILDRLTKAGIDAKPVAETGVVGLIQGETPGRTILLRADMDALPITEENDVPYRSKNQGVMHACGHDAHVAMLITAARLIAKKGIKEGAVKLVFQPAEEEAGGARQMIDEGILEDPKVDGASAFHVWSQYPVGEVVARSGPVAASVDGFKITIHGKGTHAALPESGVDPIAIAAQIINSCQYLVTRRISPMDAALLSFTAINAGTAFNVIPDKAEIKGTFRTFDDQVRTRLSAQIAQVASAISNTMGGSSDYESFAGTLPVVNDPNMAAMVREVAARVVGENNVTRRRPLMVGEDVSEIFAHVPGTLILLGCGNSEIEADFPHHHPRFNIDERVLPIGVEMALGCVKQFLYQGANPPSE